MLIKCLMVFFVARTLTVTTLIAALVRRSLIAELYCDLFFLLDFFRPGRHRQGVTQLR